MKLKITTTNCCNIKNKMASGIKYTLEDWKQICTEKHNGLYTYDLITEYKNKSQIMDIYCTKHNLLFQQCANSHIRGMTGCEECKKEKNRLGKLKEQEEVFSKIREKYPHFDLSEAEYKGMLTPIRVICRNKDRNGNEHGVFNPTPANLLNGHACKKCGDERTADSNRMGLERFLERAKKIHPNYDFSLVKEYKSVDDEIEVICHALDEFGNEHGVFKTTPHRILHGNKCRKCQNLEKITVETWKKRCEKIHCNKYDYSLVDFENVDDIVQIICPTHGVFQQCARKHMQGHGCKNCNNSFLENSVLRTLNENKIEFITHDKNILHGLELDFYLPKYNVAIECQGEQHFVPKSFGCLDEEKVLSNFELQKERDLRKKSLCKENGIKLVYFLDKQFNKYLETDDIYFNNVDDLMEYINNN